MPEKARLELGIGGAWKEVPTEALAAGDVLLVLPGDKFPVDGVVVSGTSSCNEAALTGEPMPVPHGPGIPLSLVKTLELEGVTLFSLVHPSTSSSEWSTLRRNCGPPLPVSYRPAHLQIAIQGTPV